jgi:glycerophosphoryl diester phosphodiesterase
MAARALLPLLDPGLTLVIGHRGAAAEAPENTLAAFQRAAALGVDGFELDLRVTADGVAVVIHDPTLERTTDRTETVADATLAVLRDADAGARFTVNGGLTHPWRGRGVLIPTLDEVLDAFPTMPLLVELKVPEAQAAVRDALLRHGAMERCVVSAIPHAALAMFHQPPFLRGASRRDILRLWLASKVGLTSAARDCRCFAVPVRHNDLLVTTDGFLAAARRLGRPVHVWTVDDPAVAADLWARGVSGIITNDPAAMARPPLSRVGGA